MGGAGKMLSYKLTQFKEPLIEVIEAPPAPKGAQVLLRVSACGVSPTVISTSVMGRSWTLH
jgi:D-arabinose 1-dehydrogenase-like Zn-dependent alcohol dehydrogenase